VSTNNPHLPSFRTLAADVFNGTSADQLLAALGQVFESFEVLPECLEKLLGAFLECKSGLIELFLHLRGQVGFSAAGNAIDPDDRRGGGFGLGGCCGLQ
jgi:hypothetical protein